AELFFGSAGQRLIRHGATVQGAAADLQFAVDVDLEGGSEDGAAEPFDLGAERIDVAQSGVVAVAGHHRPQQLNGPGSAANSLVGRSGVFAGDLRGIQLSGASFGAEY